MTYPFDGFLRRRYGHAADIVKLNDVGKARGKIKEFQGRNQVLWPYVTGMS
jgi:hypothetical protein